MSGTQICGYCGRYYSASTCDCAASRTVRAARTATLQRRVVLVTHQIAINHDKKLLPKGNWRL